MSTTKELLVKEASRRGVLTSSHAVELLGISRQAATRHLRELVLGKKLSRLGSTKSARYVPFDPGLIALTTGESEFSQSYALVKLEEDRVFQELDLRLGLKKALSSSAYSIVNYAFTEMLNNAIDHSKSEKVEVRASCQFGRLEFSIRDRGIGVFENIRNQFKLRNHPEAVEHLLKGKQTTDPVKHSGQGIFFTSKIADKFVLESAQLKLTLDNQVDDIFLGDIAKLKGTRVGFSLKQRSRKNLKELFDEYSNENSEFDKTKITIHLSERIDEHISRSQAKRLLFGLDAFQRIVLDFKKVRSIGQGFADEIFHVYLQRHPSTALEPIDMSPSVEFMIRRAAGNPH